MLSRNALEKVRGRAGRRGSNGPTGLDMSPHRGIRLSSSPQVRFLSSVPRAVFEACSAWPPVDTLLLSTAVGPLRPPDRENGGTAIASQGPVIRSTRTGTDAAWAAARWVCVLHPGAATASRSHSTTPRERPRLDRPARSMSPGKPTGDKFDQEIYFASGAPIRPGIVWRLLLSPPGIALVFLMVSWKLFVYSIGYKKIATPVSLSSLGPVNLPRLTWRSDRPRAARVG